MATYIPGVQDFVPQLEVFTPDYKFLSDVLDTRQDRYTTNYDQLNDLYGKVVYADLSREDNKSKRDQYANQISGRIQQITGMDLSLQQNVDAARGVFKPFYDDDLIVKDMVVTQQYKDQLETVEMMQDSPNPKVREQAWDYGVKALNYQMKDFIEADPAQALKMGAPKYVPDADLPELAAAALEKSGMTLTGTTFEGDWIVKQKNGSILVKPAREFIEQTLLDDPIVKNAYWTKAYVQAREYGEQNAEQHGSEDRAKKYWAETILDAYHKKQKLGLVESTVKLDDGLKTQADWDEYQEKNGIIVGSEQDKQYMKMLAEVAMLNDVKNMKTNHVAMQAEPVKDLDQLLNKAYSALMGEDIGADMHKAAVAYANVDASVEVEVNPIRKMRHEQNFTEHMEEVKQRNKKDLAYDKYLYDLSITEREAELEALNAGYQSWDDESQGVERDDISGTEWSPIMQDEDDNIVDYFTDNDISQMNDAKQIMASKFQVIAETATQLKGETHYVTTDANGNKVSMTWTDARKELMKEENEQKLNDLYYGIKNNMLYAKDKRPTWITNDKAEAYEVLANASSEIDDHIRHANRASEKQNEFYAGLFDQFINTEYGKEWKENYQDGMPSIFTNQAWKDGFNDKDKDIQYAGKIHEEVVREMEEEEPGITKRMYGQNADDYLKRKLIGKDEYIDLFMKYAYGGKEYNDDDLDNNANPYWNYDAPWSTKQSAYWFGGGDPGKNIENRRPMIIPGPGGATSEYYKKIHRTKDGYEHKWMFDREQALEDAAESYDDQKEAYNVFMNTAPAEGEGESMTWSYRKHMTGLPQTGLGAQKAPGYSFVYDHANQNPQAKDQLKRMFALVHGDKSSRIVRFGDESGNLKGRTDEPKAKFVLENLWRDVYTTFGSKNDKTGAPKLTVTYAEHLGGKGGKGEFGGYILEFSPAYAKLLKGKKSEPTNEMIPEGTWKNNTLTVFVKKEADTNPYSSKIRKPSYVEMAVDDDGEAEYEQYPGGGIKLFKNASGQMMEQTWNYQYDNNPESNSFTQFIKTIQQPQLLELKGVTMDAYVREVKRTNGILAQNQNKREADTKLLYPDKVRKSSTKTKETNVSYKPRRSSSRTYTPGIMDVRGQMSLYDDL